MRRLINAFAIEYAVTFVFLWVNVPVYVSLQFMFDCLSFSFRTIKEKNTSFFLLIHSHCACSNKNMKNRQTPEDVGCLQQRRGSDCTAAQCLSLSSQACFTHFDDYKTSH